MKLYLFYLLWLKHSPSLFQPPWSLGAGLPLSLLLLGTWDMLSSHLVPHPHHCNLIPCGIVCLSVLLIGPAHTEGRNCFWVKHFFFNFWCLHCYKRKSDKAHYCRDDVKHGVACIVQCPLYKDPVEKLASHPSYRQNQVAPEKQVCFPWWVPWTAVTLACPFLVWSLGSSELKMWF